MKSKVLLLTLLIAGIASSVHAMDIRVKEILADVEKQVAPDKRQIVYEISAADGISGDIVLNGKTSEQSAIDALKDALQQADISFTDKVTVLPSDLWALPRISVANIRTRPGHGSELSSQALMGMPVRLLEKDGEWWHVQTPDGYLGWIVDNSLAIKSPEEMEAWRKADRAVVTSVYQTRCYNSPQASGLRDVVSDLVNGDIVEMIGADVTADRTLIRIPDGREAWVNNSDITDMTSWAAQTFDAQKILNMAYSMEGQPYLWGGTSTKSLDCSGLAKVCYLSNGIILRRDASQQALTGTRAKASDWRKCKPGDLLFFGNPETGRVTHVAIYDNSGNYVHSSGRVRRNSVDPSSTSYLTTPFLHSVRISGNEGSEGITRVKDHPWYF